MKKYFIAIAATALLFSSCGISHKDLSETLSSKQLSEIMEDNNDFLNTYKAIREKPDTFFIGENSTYKSVTFKDIAEYAQYMNDEEFWTKKGAKIGKKWQKKFGKKIKKAEKAIDKWHTIIDNSKLNTYVDFEIESVETDSNNITTVDLYVKPKNKEVVVENIDLTIMAIVDEDTVTRHCTYSNKIEYKSNHQIKIKVDNLQKEELYAFNNKWTRHIEDLQVTINGEVYPNFDYEEDMPKKLRKYFGIIDNPNVGNLNAYLKDKYDMNACECDSTCWVDNEIYQLQVVAYPLEYMLAKELNLSFVNGIKSGKSGNSSKQSNGFEGLMKY